MVDGKLTVISDLWVAGDFGLFGILCAGNFMHLHFDRASANLEQKVEM